MLRVTRGLPGDARREEAPCRPATFTHRAGTSPSPAGRDAAPLEPTEPSVRTFRWYRSPRRQPGRACPTEPLLHADQPTGVVNSRAMTKQRPDYSRAAGGAALGARLRR